LLALMLGVKVCWLVLFVKHPHDDSEEHRNNRHVVEYTPAPSVFPNATESAAPPRSTTVVDPERRAMRFRMDTAFVENDVGSSAG
ncbi:MAG TPA: hypothetical protein VF962_02145, partial [Gemmatimonadaceae bacterium]